MTAFLIPFLESIFVTSKHVTVYTREDRIGLDFTNVGPLVTKGDISVVSNDSVMAGIISDTINARLSDGQPTLWMSGKGVSNTTTISAALLPVCDDNSHATCGSISNPYGELGQRLFSSSLPVGTDTGALRQLAARFNTSISCQTVPQSAFPSSCSGESPFSQSFTNVDDSDSNPYAHTDYPRFKGRICAPGNMFASPWNPNRTAQKVSEEVWIDFQFSNMSRFIELGGYSGDYTVRSNFTQYCSSNTSLGYYELPNYWNGHTVGPLLEDPLPDGGNNGFFNAHYVRYPDRIIDDEKPAVGVPGPLLTSVLAIFGPNTFFDIVSKSSNYNVTKYSGLSLAFCHQLYFPFRLLQFEDVGLEVPSSGSSLSGWDVQTIAADCFNEHNAQNEEPTTPDLLRAFMNWMPNFADSSSANAAFTLTAYAVHKRLFTPSNLDVNNIEAAAGRSYERPDVSNAGVVIVSLLLGLQLLGLGLLALYAQRRPVWTETLDASAVIRLGVQLAKSKDLTHGSTAIGLGTSKDEIIPYLDQVEGWVGADGGEIVHDSSSSDHNKDEQIQRLVLGGEVPVRAGRAC